MSTRPIPRDRRARELRGTPPEPAVLELATTYLEEQARLWPAAVGTLLPPPTPAAAAELAERFRAAGLPDPAAADLAVPAGAGEVAAAYLRYSSDHSNPRSLDQQLRNVLVRAAADRAAADRAFVPWAFVFADAAVTGTTAARRGYQQAKAAVRGPAAGPARLYLDELGRASRDAVEALRLGRLVDRVGKRLVGVTDGFDSALPQSKMMLALFAMLHEWFVDQLRAKVRRGMADAFGQGRTVTAPAVGYRMVAVAGPDGTPAVTATGRPVRARAIDPAGAGHVREAFRLYADEGWSPGRVARQFNQRQVAGRTSWNRTNVVQLLTRQTYAGVEWYNRTTQHRDPDTGTVTTRTRPRDEWLRREVPDLRIVPDDLWARAQARLAAVRDAHRARAGGPTAPARTAVYPSVLVRPVCGYCRVPLWVGRSGKYPALHCHRGRDRR
ncbi:MAG: recombinase family protein, partial [Gemmataceae bacterium]